MDIYKQAERFLYLCAQAQQSNLTDVAFDAMEAKLKPGESFNVADVNEAGKMFYAGLVRNEPDNILKGFNKLLELTRDGGGELYNNLKKIENQVNEQYKPKPKPKYFISKNYYNILFELERMAASMSKSLDPDNLAKVKDKYESLKDKIEDTKEYLKFIAAMGVTQQYSNNPSEKSDALLKTKEVNNFTSRLNKSVKTIENKLFDFAGKETPTKLPEV